MKTFVALLVVLSFASTAHAQQNRAQRPAKAKKASVKPVATPAVAKPATTPVCQIGTEFAVNPGRELAPGEKVVTLPASFLGGKVVVTTQREKPGSSHIVLRRCALAPESLDVVVGGPSPWFRKCGQDFAPEGWALPQEPPPAPPAPPAAPVPTTGTLKIDVSGTVKHEHEHEHSGEVGLVHRGDVGLKSAFDSLATATPPKKGRCGWKCKTAIGVGAAAVGVGAGYAIRNSRRSPGPTIVTTVVIK